MTKVVPDLLEGQALNNPANHCSDPSFDGFGAAATTASMRL